RAWVGKSRKIAPADGTRSAAEKGLLHARWACSAMNLRRFSAQGNAVARGRDVSTCEGFRMPAGNVRYHGEYWGQSGPEMRLSMSQLLGPDCRSTPSNLI